MATYKAVEIERGTRVPTGHSLELEASTRDEAIALLLKAVDVTVSHARIDPTRTLVVIGDQSWLLVKRGAAAAVDPPGLRRAGAKHRRVR